MYIQRVENDLFLAQGEMASGHMVEFKIDPSLIGKKTTNTYFHIVNTLI